MVVSSHRLAVEVYDEKRFCKAITGGLWEMRNLIGDGLFSAKHGEPNWAPARTHNRLAA
jgi:cytochrome P450/NADPH-cytochrome P450 reductase